jgi:hypothetical protein
MNTRTKKMAVATTLGTFAVLAILLAYPAMATTSSAQPGANAQQLLQNSSKAIPEKISYSVGQTITLTSVAGGFHEVGNPSVNGTASGTLTLQVTGVFAGGYSLTVSGGSFVINGSTYTVSGGSAEMGPYGYHMVGQGQAGTASFLFRFSDLGKFGSSNYAIVGVDLSAGSSQWLSRLLVTVTAS